MNKMPIVMIKSCGSPPKIEIQRKRTVRNSHDLLSDSRPFLNVQSITGNQIAVERLFKLLTEEIT
jgi:hypothetical protein